MHSSIIYVLSVEERTLKVLGWIFMLLVPVTLWGAVDEYPDTVRTRGMILASPFDIKGAREVDTVIVYDERYVVFAPPVLPPSELILKYASKMGVDPSVLNNEKIYEFIDVWIGTRYRYGGNTRRGIDCSALTRTLHKDISQVELPRSSREMYNSPLVKRIEGAKNDISLLKEGDLVFFRRRGYIFHVGVYLGGDKFLSANRSTGVGISSLTKGYWGRYYYAAARLVEDETKEEDIELN